MSYYAKDLLAGRVALVTGGGSGICEGIARGFAAHGAKLVLVGRTLEKLERVARAIQESGGEAIAAAADVRKPDQVESAVNAALAAYGQLDIVVNGAAGNFLAPAAALSPNGFRTVIDIDLCGSFNVVRAAFAHLTRTRGCVLNISANLQCGGTPMQVHAASAKAGLDAMTRSLAVEWGPAGVRVNALAPGPIDATEGMSRLAPGDIKKKLEAVIPLKRFGTIDEMANAALFLCSDAATYVTGEVLIADGGQWLAPAGMMALLG